MGLTGPVGASVPDLKAMQKKKSGRWPSASDDMASELGVFSEINITPLTDVFLVLLIIFMVTASASQTANEQNQKASVAVELPESSQAQQGASPSQPEGVVLTLLSDGSLKIGDVPAPQAREERLSLLKQTIEKTRGKWVVLDGDRKAPLEKVVEVMDLARESGALQFSLSARLKGSR